MRGQGRTDRRRIGLCRDVRVVDHADRRCLWLRLARSAATATAVQRDVAARGPVGRESL